MTWKGMVDRGIHCRSIRNESREDRVLAGVIYQRFCSWGSTLDFLIIIYVRLNRSTPINVLVPSNRSDNDIVISIKHLGHGALSAPCERWFDGRSNNFYYEQEKWTMEPKIKTKHQPVVGCFSLSFSLSLLRRKIVKIEWTTKKTRSPTSHVQSVMISSLDYSFIVPTFSKSSCNWTPGTARKHRHTFTQVRQTVKRTRKCTQQKKRPN